MAKLISGRLKNLNIGVSSYTENNNVLVATGNAVFTGFVTASSFKGDGSGLTGIPNGVAVASSDQVIGYGATILNFIGSGISAVTVSSGIATINVANTAITKVDIIARSGIVTISTFNGKLTVFGRSQNTEITF